MFIKLIGRFNWTGIKYALTMREYNLTDEDIDKAIITLSNGHYICLSRRNSHLSTYAANIAYLFMTLRYGRGLIKPKLGYWGHCFMTVGSGTELDVIEAIGKGVSRSSFYRALNVDSLVILKPKYFSDEEMQRADEIAQTYIGRLYDEGFDLNDDSRLSCVELSFRCLSRVKSYALPGLNSMIRRLGNLTPQMFYDCEDFEVVLEIRR